MKKMLILFALCSLSLESSTLEAINRGFHTAEEKIKYIAHESKRIFKQYTHEMIDYMAAKFHRDHPIYEITTPVLDQYYQKFNEEMQDKLIKYYELDNDPEYVKIMKRNPEKYGLTFTAYKLLED